MTERPDSYFISADTGDRVEATYRVHLTIPVLHDGYVDLKANSESEAAELALRRHLYEIEWECQEEGDMLGMQVCCVECEEPPENSLLVHQSNRDSGANLDAIFAPGPPQE